MNETTFRDKLEEKTKDELKVLAKKLRISGYSSFNKQEIIDFILKSDVSKLEKEICPSWWYKYHNHVYGIATVLALVLALVFYLVPLPDNEDQYLEGTWENAAKTQRHTFLPNNSVIF